MFIFLYTKLFVLKEKFETSVFVLKKLKSDDTYKKNLIVKNLIQ